MASANRAALIGKAHKVLKKHYKPVDYIERPLLEQLLFACCLENATYDAAEAAFQKLASGFFDWNEVRVSTVEELAESLPMLSEPRTAAANVKRILYAVFESTYSFEIEAFKKLNLGVAQQKLEKLTGVTPFALAVVTQASLGGHAIPLDRGTLNALRVLGIATDEDVSKHQVPGMERAIPKNKGVEFGSLLHQLGAEMTANPYSTNFHKILLEIAPEAKDRLPKRMPKPVAAAKPEADAAAAKSPTDTADTKALAKGDSAATKAGKKGLEKTAPTHKVADSKAHDPKPNEKPAAKSTAKAADKLHDGKPHDSKAHDKAAEKKAAPAEKKPAAKKPEAAPSKAERPRSTAKESPKKKAGEAAKRKPR